ncbi:efflux RND transporter periplasmic adaptor subunit [Fibrobacterota bacterium]
MTKKAIIITALIALAFFIGTFFGGGGNNESAHQHEEGKEEAQSQTWTCSMHPQIKLPKPGKCPICFMDLIPLEKGSDEEGERQLSMSIASKKLAEIEITPVQRNNVSAEVRMVGKIEYDETRVKVISSRIPGRLDKLFVDYTGVPIKKGEHLVSIYSPDLYTAQEELLQAIKTSGNLSAGGGIIERTAKATIDAARERLYQWGLTENQIKQIEEKGVADDHLTIYAPMAGVVVHKNAVEGMYVNTGTRLYTIADLSKLWVKLDAYESDLAWLRYGQEVEFSAEAIQGETFKGRIGFIDPILDPKTRTVKIRVNVTNKNKRLKPDMFVTGIVKAKVSSEGKVIDNYLAGKWIGPMHPEIIKNRPGKCDICGMPLVRAETMGFSKSRKDKRVPLVIPATAVLITGKRAVVYLAVDNKDKPTFEGREVVLGPRAGNYYIVKSGLEEGEKVVTKGAFKIDAEMQIQAKPSMMSPDGGTPAPGHDHGDKKAASKPVQEDHEKHKAARTPDKSKLKDFIKELDGLYTAYFLAQTALAKDDMKSSRQALNKLKKATNAVNMKKAKGQAHESWMSTLNRLNKELEHVMHLGNISGIREAFRSVSNTLIDLEKNFGHAGGKKHFVAFCPMAFDNKGGSWLQTEETINNPYYGAAMLRCGEIKEEIGGQ